MCHFVPIESIRTVDSIKKKPVQAMVGLRCLRLAPFFFFGDVARGRRSRKDDEIPAKGETVVVDLHRHYRGTERANSSAVDGIDFD